MPADVIRLLSPADGSLVAERPRPDPAAIERALAAAETARHTWRHTPLDERRALCARMVALLADDADAIGEELARQMGRPIRYAPMEIRRGFAERAAFFLEAAPNCLADVPGAKRDGFDLFMRREPLGTVLVVAPWNYPYLTAVNAFLPALLAGNPVLLKHSDQTLLCAERLTAAFAAAGGPPGVFQHLHLDHSQVAAIIRDPRIRHVAFTGSVPGGHAIQQAASTRFITTGLELGGKDPAYVRADADLDHAVENIVDGAFFNSGQSCCGIERIYVHADLFDTFVERAVALVREYRLGSPLDPATTLGPMIRTSAADFVREQVAEALTLGARAWIDPREFAHDAPGSPYLAPQVLTQVDHRMRLMSEETFGPAVGIMPVADDAEALQLMNDSAYGLTASIWTRDPAAALVLGNSLETGTVFLNRCDYLDPSLAWTGIRDTGRGVTLSRFGFDAFIRLKSYHLRLP
jgi:acyl-CoA reductase-like NAD-dependent aldehyde dehydrogenase